jgi:hypothetical protein
MSETIFFGGRSAPGFGVADPPPTQRRLSPLLTFPAGGAAIGGLIGYCVKKDAHGADVGALIGSAAPFALAAVIIASGWSP